MLSITSPAGLLLDGEGWAVAVRKDWKMSSKILLRDDFSDTGQVPFATRFKSPDLITYKQALDPRSIFTANYTSDPNIPVEPKNNNYIYVRVKNIGDQTSDPLYVHLYANQLSLYLDPSRWQQNQIHTVGGSRYSFLPVVAPGKIGVTMDYFVFNAKSYNGNCCLVGVAGDTPRPDYSWIDSYQKYAAWVANNPNVATRNMVTSTSYAVREFEDRLNISNSYDSRAVVIFEVSAFGLPKGTIFGITCDSLGVDASAKFDAAVPASQTFLANAYVPSGYDDYVSFYGVLPAGTSQWPVDAYITVAARIAFRADLLSNADSFIHRVSWRHYHAEQFVTDRLRPQANSAADAFAAGPLIGVPLGECGHIYR